MRGWTAMRLLSRLCGCERRTLDNLPPQPRGRARNPVSLILLVGLMGLAALGATTENAEPSAETPASPSAEASEATKEIPGLIGIEDVSWEGKVVSIVVDDAIYGKPFSDAVERVRIAVDRADRQKARLILIELDTPGGMVDACDAISNKLLHAKTPTAALVLHKAVSGGAVLAVACQEIAMCEGSRMGDVQPMMSAPTGDNMQLDERTAEKAEADVRKLLTSLAQKHNRPEPLYEAMVTRSLELYVVHFKDGSREFMTKAQLELLEANVERGRDDRVIADTKLISEKGYLLELSPREAVEYGAADLVVANRAAYFAEKEIALDDVVTIPLNGATIDLAAIIKGLAPDLPGWVVMLLAVFLIAGIAGIVTELNTPGFGIPGAIGLIGFAAFFSTLMMYDRGSWVGIVFFVIGLALLIVEIVVLPGFGIPGILGIAAILLGLFLAYAPPLEAPNVSFSHELGEFVPFLLIVIAVAIVVCWLIITYGKFIPGLRGVFMREELKSGQEINAELREDAIEEWKPRGPHLDMTGVAATDLRPAGKVRLDNGELGDARTQGDFIEKDRRVKVVDEQLAAWVVVLDDERRG